MLLFSDISFWLVFVFFLAFYALIRRYSRVGMLLYVVAFSLLFFWMANGWLMLLLSSVAVISWWAARTLAPIQGASSSASYLRKVTLWVTILVILLPLLYYKYCNFFLASLNNLVASNFPLFEITLPVGISFFTFQAISYVVDVYKGRFTMKVSFLEYLFFLSFFPLLLAGPITRAETLLPQIRRHHPVSERCLYLGLWLVVLGLIKKCVVADYIAQYNDWIFSDPLAYSGFECLMGILGYTVQIYCDFSGYSDMSIGIAALLGFRLRENFAFPYRAHNPSEFWRRWHISLSTWFRDYLYIPMGGNRCGRARTYLNNIITMLVAGLWHGASWMFVIWGAIHGLGLVFHKMLMPWLKKIPNSFIVRQLCGIFCFLLVAFAWVFFRSESVEIAWLLLTHTFSDFDIAYFVPFVQVRFSWTLLVLLPLLTQWVSDRGFRRLQVRFICLPWWIKLVIFAFTLQLILQFSTRNVQPFIYSQF